MGAGLNHYGLLCLRTYDRNVRYHIFSSKRERGNERSKEVR